MYADNDYKFVVVLNEKIEVPKLMNALGHMTAGLVGSCNDIPSMKFLHYVDGDETSHPSISHYPFIVLSAANGNQIRTLRKNAIEANILYTDFVDTMLGFSANDQLQKTYNTLEKDLVYFGIALFGKAEVLNLLTKKFSLFK
jgi:hypothetical protein